MAKRPDIEFDVRWLPFQLNPNSSQQASSRMQAYADKFGKSNAEVKQMSAWMGQKFTDAGLPFKFTEAALISNTFDAHRVLTAAYEKGGAQAQDKAAEILFHSYFAEERAPNDPGALEKAANAAGVDGKALLADGNFAAAQTKEELTVGQRLGVSGVPFFVIKQEGSQREEKISGAEPPAAFIHAFSKIAKQ